MLAMVSQLDIRFLERSRPWMPVLCNVVSDSALKKGRMQGGVVGYVFCIDVGLADVGIVRNIAS